MLNVVLNSHTRPLMLLAAALLSCNSSQPIQPSNNGLRASYFNGESLGGTPVTRVEPNINFAWGNEAPQGFSVDNFSARFEGSVVPKYSEVYTFSADADEGLRVWVNGVKLIDRWGYHDYIDYSKLKLEANKKYAIKIEYHEGKVSTRARMKFSWQSASQDKQIIPTTALFTDDGVAEGLPENAPLRVLAEARGIKIGAEIGKKAFDENATYREILNREFNHSQPGGECLATSTHKANDPLRLNLDSKGRLEPFDTLLDAAEANNQSTQCFHLVWYEEARWTPFLNTLSVEDRRTFVKNRITDMIKRYKGRVESWNVVNEAFTDEGNGTVTTRPRTFSKDGGKTNYVNWLYDLGTGTEYIAEAFKTAREADPTAKLFYNDYGIENGAPENGDLSKPTWNTKWNAVLDMVRDFKTRPTPIPIDGVGFQSHIFLDTWSTPENLVAMARNLNLHFRSLYAIDPKLEARITELDVNLKNPADLSESTRIERQNLLYSEMVKACLSAPNCTALSTWGISDQYSWMSDPIWGGSPDTKPLLFDDKMQPKAAYYAVRDALLGK